MVLNLRTKYSSCMILILAIVDDIEEFVERDAVHKALMALLRQDVKGNLGSFSVN